MSIQQMFLGAGPKGSNYEIERSLRFTGLDDTYLTRTPSSLGNSTTWTMSVWFKVNTARPVGYPAIFGANTYDGYRAFLRYKWDGELEFFAGSTTTGAERHQTLEVYRDASAWYHLVLKWDTNNSTAADRCILYINGVRQTWDGTFGSGATCAFNSTVENQIGHEATFTQRNFDGYLAEYHFVDGTALDADSFGEFNEDTGVWDPKEYEGGSYGTNGFYLKFNNTSDLGEDSSGNGNDWTATNFSTTAGIDNDSLTDTPTDYGNDTGLGGEVRGNYCTWNPFDNGKRSTPGVVTLAQGNLKVNGATGTNTYGRIIHGTFGMSSGKYYWEIKRVSGSAAYTLLGIDSGSMPDTGIDESPTAYTIKETTGWKYNNNTSAAYDTTWQAEGLQGLWTNGDTISMAFDADTGTLWYAKNGTWMNSATTAEIEAGTTTNAAWTGLSGTFRPVLGFYHTDEVHEANFGQRPFAYTAPSGYKCLCTQNLPNPKIKDPSKHFDVATATGNSILSAANALTDGADFVWIKDRDTSSTNHILFNRINNPDMDGDTHMRSNEPDDEDDCQSYSAPAGNSVAWVWNAGTTNTPVSAGDLNSSLIDQSVDWSGNNNATTGPVTTSTGSYYSTSSAEDLFDYNTTVSCFPQNAGEWVKWEPGSVTGGTNYTFTNSVEVHVTTNTAGSEQVVTYTDSEDNTSTVTLSNIGWNTITTGGGVLKSLKMQSASGAWTYWTAIRIDGKILVDSGNALNIPSIDSTYRANTDAGFSIVSYTGSGTSGDTVAHGLNDKPQLILTKNRDNNDYWAVYHTSLTSGYALQLDDAAGEFAGSQIYTSTAPTSSAFTVGDNDVVNASSEKYISYCWSEVAGYSKFSSYVGNDDVEGIFEFTGFKPAFLLLKSKYSNSPNWCMVDSTQDPHNAVSSQLYPNSNSKAYDSAFVDFLSNGFKMRHSGNSGNASAHTYMYCAFAEHPFKHSRAR